MDSSYYNVTFDGCGSTLVRARTADDAMLLGRQFSQNNRTNVRITTPDAQSFTVDEFDAIFALAGKADR